MSSNYHINKIIKTLIFSDVLILGSFGLINPIFAIFIDEQIIGGGVEVAGFAAAIYLLTKSFLQIFVGRHVDKDHKDKDDFWFLAIGTLLIALVPLLYIYSFYPWHIYLLQIMYGVGAAMSFPTWMAIFTRHLDKFHEAYQWGIYDTSTGLVAGITAVFGGIVASKYGFDTLFYLISGITLLGLMILFLVYKAIIKSDKRIKFDV